MHKRSLVFRSCTRLALMILLLTIVPSVNAQDSLQQRIQALQEAAIELRAMLEEMKAEINRSRAEAAALRRELELTREHLSSANPLTRDKVTDSADGLVAGETQSSQGDIERVQEDLQLLQAKVDEQYQTKVESASKYRVRLSGLVLVNLLNTKGAVDNLDSPSFVHADHPMYPRGSFAASVRQSLFGLEVFGPEIKGMRTAGDVQFDFAGGFPNAPDGVTFPLPRLRTAMIRLSSPDTTIAAGQDSPFFSPLSPTSVATLAVPAMSYSGNLWTWIPQARIEHRFNIASDASIALQGGILDPLTGEPPYSQFFRIPQPGEQSRQPAYASRVALSRRLSGREFTVGVGGYYSRQNWSFNRAIDAWAGTSDWTIPLGRPFEFSGEFYYGRAIGGLGGGFGRSVVLSGPITDPVTRIKPLNSTGGWGQVKFRQTERFEWNVAFGQDKVQAPDLSLFPLAQQTSYDPSVIRNRSSLVNFVYRPRSDVLLSMEYRRLHTFRIVGEAERAVQINLGMGVMF